MQQDLRSAVTAAREVLDNSGVFVGAVGGSSRPLKKSVTIAYEA